MIDASLDHMTCKVSRDDFVPSRKRAQFKPFYWKKMINIKRRKERLHVRNRRTAI